MKKDFLTHLYTSEGESLPRQPWTVYPRPQLKRDSFFCLNGPWDFYETPKTKETITVPFPPESALSGIGRRLKKSPCIRYERTFVLPEGFVKDRVLLHFGAVDQVATVTLNGNEIGTHRGGYESFGFDITEFLQDINRLTVTVTDDLPSHTLPYGKQCERRGGMWYTPVTGIWQTVWIESVCKDYIRSVRIETGINFVKIFTEGARKGFVTVQTPNGPVTAMMERGITTVLFDTPRMWSPEDPYLYYFTVKAGEDEVSSYFALRTLDIKTIDGLPRLCLNGKPYFFHGILDQGYYSDGIFTPASPQNYTRDILEMKQLGFNMLRKHIKIEPEQFYYDCDRLGMVVFQDMVNNGKYSFFRDTALPTVGLKRLPDKYLHRNKAARSAFEEGMKSTVNQLYNHPSVCYWTIFNEGWGQFNSDAMYEKLKGMDDSRFIDSTSGWFKGKRSDVESLHVYFKPVKINPCDRPVILSEFGGYSYQPEGHVFNPGKAYGYRFFQDRKEFEDALIKLYETEVIPGIQRGLCAAVYTQVSDVEDETNGLLSYDRKVLKVTPEKMLGIAKQLKI